MQSNHPLSQAGVEGQGLEHFRPAHCPRRRKERTMNEPNKKLNVRAFVALMIGFCVVGLPVTGVVNHLNEFSPVSVEGHAWHSSHNVLGVLLWCSPSGTSCSTAAPCGTTSGARLRASRPSVASLFSLASSSRLFSLCSSVTNSLPMDGDDVGFRLVLSVGQ